MSVVSPVGMTMVMTMVMVMVNVSDLNSVGVMMVVVVNNLSVVVVSVNVSDDNSWSVAYNNNWIRFLFYDFNWFLDWNWLDWNWVLLKFSENLFKLLDAVGRKNSQDVKVGSVFFNIHGVDSGDSSLVLGWGNVGLSVQQIFFTSGSPMGLVVDVVEIVPVDV